MFKIFAKGYKLAPNLLRKSNFIQLLMNKFGSKICKESKINSAKNKYLIFQIILILEGRPYEKDTTIVIDILDLFDIYNFWLCDNGICTSVRS